MSTLSGSIEGARGSPVEVHEYLAFESAPRSLPSLRALPDVCQRCLLVSASALRQRLARDEVALRRAEKHRGADDVLRKLRALDRTGLKPLLVLRVEHRVDLVHADRESRRDGIDGDVVLAELARQGPREPDHAGLRRHVVRGIRRAVEDGPRLVLSRLFHRPFDCVACLHLKNGKTTE